jgi:transcriptional regulator GlxA family with amidase domain
MAPYDVIHHSIFRDTLDYVEPFVVSPDGGTVTTFEGLEIGAHYSFESAPAIDILIIPSAEGSMSWDLQNDDLIDWIRSTASEADYVITLCDGAFPLAATGLLDGKTVTTFPADRDALAAMFTELDVHYTTNFVVDGKYITSVGGALSYEPALYLMETMYSRRHAEEIGKGLVLNWDLSSVPHFIVSEETAHE